MKRTKIEEILSSNPAYHSYNSSRDLSFEIADMLLRARISRGLSQDKLSKLIKSKQPNIARIESGNYLPSLKTLDKIAKAFNSYLIAPKFAFLEEEDKDVATLINNKKFSNDNATNVELCNISWTWTPLSKPIVNTHSQYMLAHQISA